MPLCFCLTTGRDFWTREERRPHSNSNIAAGNESPTARFHPLATSTRQFIPFPLDAAEVGERMSILDVGCGPGYVSRVPRLGAGRHQLVSIFGEMIARSHGRNFPRSSSTKAMHRIYSFADSTFDCMLAKLRAPPSYRSGTRMCGSVSGFETGRPIRLHHLGAEGRKSPSCNWLTTPFGACRSRGRAASRATVLPLRE